jgi:hypothetical protein
MGGTPRVFDGRGVMRQTTPIAEPQGVPTDFPDTLTYITIRPRTTQTNTIA